MMCAMRIRHELSYDATPDEVYTMLADPAFRDQVCDAMDVVSRDVTIDGGADAMTVRIDMVQRTQGVPGFAKKIVGDQTRLVQSERWTARRSADLQVQIPGRPGHVAGRITLAQDGARTVETFEGDVSINIPLVGGKLEGLIGKLFVKSMDTEQRVGAAWLAEGR